MATRTTKRVKVEVKALRTILVADDELLIARGICGQLDKMGYVAVGPASNGLLAVEMARQHKPDLAVLDIRMPEMDGLEAAGLIYDELGIPVVIASAYSDDSNLNQAVTHGVFGYIIKPVTIETLRVTLEVAWSRYLKQDLLTDEIKTLRVEIEQRKVIEKAKGVVMERMSLTEDEAMKRLQKQSRDTRRPLIEIASSILEADKMFKG